MLHLGIDIGTTKVSAAIAAEDMSFHAAAAANHNASVPREEGFFEQDFDKIEDAFKLMDSKPRDLIKPYVLI